MIKCPYSLTSLSQVMATLTLFRRYRSTCNWR